MIQTQPATVADFSGGIVDDYVNGRPNQAQFLSNVYCAENKSLMLRPGSVVDDLVNPQIPAGNQAIRTLINHDDDDALLVQSGKRFYYRNPSAYATLSGPTSNDAFDLGDASSIVSHTQWQGHTYFTNSAFSKITKVFRDSSNTLRLRTAGLPALASSPVVTAGAAGARNYIYAFHYAYSYTVGTQEYLDSGPTTLVELNASGDPSVNPNPITVIPVLSNGSVTNWDTATIKVFIFRSTDGGTTYYKIGEVTNGTTTFNDNYADTIISDNEVIYTEGGVPDNDEPPRCKFVHVVENRMYAAHLKEGTQILESDVLQSQNGDPDSMPATFRDTVEDSITGLSSVTEIPIVLCKKKIYRIDNQFDELGRGSMVHVRLHDSAGCVSNNSCVQAEQGLFWAGNDGFYYTDGARAFKISDQINKSYKTFIEEMDSTGDLERITGRYDEENRRIIWSVQRDSASLQNDSMFILDLRWGISDRMPLFVWEGEDSFRPSAIEFFQKKLYRADSRGYVFVHDEDYFTDPKVDTAVAANLWNKLTIIYNYVSVASNFGSDFLRKWVPRILLTAKNKSNISIQINVINDDGKFTRSLAQIRYRNNFVWGDPEFSWGFEECVWNAEGLIEEWRRLPARGLRCSYLQVQVTNAFTVITSSDILGTATVDNAAKSVLLDDAATVDWPTDSVDYSIAFDDDNYEKEYLITSRSADTLIYSDSGNQSPNGSRSWVIRGYKKEEVLNLLSYTLHFALLSKTQTNLGGTGTGEVA